MFGDAPTASTGTGLSQEELLQRKKREDSWRRRKERRQHQPKKVQLPSSLLFTGTSSSSSPTKVDRSSGHTRSTHDTAAAVVVAPPPASSSSTRPPDNGSEDEFGLPSFFNNGVGMNEYKQHQTTSNTATAASTAARANTAPTSSSPSQSNHQTPTTGRLSGTNMGTATNSRKKSLDKDTGLNSDKQEDGKGVRFEVDLETQGAVDSNNNINSKGSRSSMVRRQRGDKSSSGRRWKIVRVEEEPEGATTSAENDKKQSPKADPPVEDIRSINGLTRGSPASSRAKVPMDPPSGSEHERDPEQTLQAEREPSEVITEVHSPSLTMNVRANLESKSRRDDSEIHSGMPPALTHPAKDEFDRFMDRPSFHTSGSPRRTRAFNPNDDASAEEYLTIIRNMNETPRLTMLPSSADFTPKSEYSRSLFASKNGTTKPSPTSVLDFNSPGVRWRETLTQEEFVTPETVKLYPYAPEKEKGTIMGLPRSILRTGANKGRRGPDETDSQHTSHTHDCPSDESPRKKASDRATKTLEVPTETGVYSEPLGDIGFMDMSGRSVSPIPGEGSLNTDDDETDGRLGHQWSESDAIFEKNIPSEFQKAFLSENPAKGENDDSGHISDSYVNFIEAVAAVVIQTKVRQHLAALLVCQVRAQMRALQGEAETTRNREESRANVLRVATPRACGSNAGASSTAKQSNNGPLPFTTTKAEPAFDFFALAAIRIQAAFRGWWVRDCIAVDHYCATTIQKTYRGFVSRTRYVVSLYSIVMVQSIWRRQIAIRRVQSHEMSMLHVQHYGRAATKIQSLWRCFYCEMKFLRDYEDILLVQSIARGWIARRLIRSWLRAHETITSPRARGAVKVASKRQERQQKQPSPSRPTTPGRKPSARVDISPSYLHHIEYMRTQLAIPRSSADDVGSSFGEAKPVGRQLFPTAKADVREQIGATYAKAVDREVLDHEVPDSQDVAPDDEIWTTERSFITEPSKEGVAEQAAPAQNAARLEIEKRRKQKEVKAKELKEEENRRREARAAELAELEMRRKRMALKAEARKREEEAKAAVEATSQAVAERNNNTDRFSHSEEKKESDSVSSTKDTPVVVPVSTVSSVETPSKAGDGAFRLLARWEKRSRGENVETPSPLASKPGPKTKTTEILETLDDAEKFVSPFSPRFPGPVSETEKLADVVTEETEPNSQEDSALTVSDAGSLTKVEEVKMHHNSQHIEATDQPDAEGQPRIRVSGSAATYQAHMRSQRNEAEQRRIDQMHEMFKRAGIMNRTKLQRI